MLNIVKLALRIVTTAYDDEISLYINECLSEMVGLGVLSTVANANTDDPQIQGAVIAYCKWVFGDAENKDQFKAIYERKLEQLKTMTGYTDFEGGC